MPLPDRLGQLALSRIQQSVRDYACHTCGSHEHVVDPTVFTLTESEHASTELYKMSLQAVPLILRTCAKCGHVTPFNAIALGIIDKRTGKPIDAY